MALCEQCKIEINGDYGSGRFCSQKCSNTFSSNQRKDSRIKKIKKAMENFNPWDGLSDEKINTIKKKISETKRKQIQELVDTGDWSKYPHTIQRKTVLIEQEGKCAICNISNWNNKKLTLHFDHINGDNKDNSRNNVRFICPNCHSQTKTYCGNKQKLPQYEYLKTTKNRLNAGVAQ